MLPECLCVKIIYDIMLMELYEKQKNLINKNKTIFSLLLNTCCHGCGIKNNVCLTGYCGRYCDKNCWLQANDEYNIYYQPNKLKYIYDKYNYLEDVDTTSKAISKYHRQYFDSKSYTKKVWPMINKPCDNWSIINRKTKNFI